MTALLKKAIEYQRNSGRHNIELNKVLIVADMLHELPPDLDGKFRP